MITASQARANVARWRAQLAAQPGRCYSDHNHDVDRKGSCDYCGGTAPDGDPTHTTGVVLGGAR